MCVYVRVYVRVYVNVCQCVYLCVCVYVCMHLRQCVYFCVCMYLCVLFVIDNVAIGSSPLCLSVVGHRFDTCPYSRIRGSSSWVHFFFYGNPLYLVDALGSDSNDTKRAHSSAAHRRRQVHGLISPRARCTRVDQRIHRASNVP